MSSIPVAQGPDNYYPRTVEFSLMYLKRRYVLITVQDVDFRPLTRRLGGTRRASEFGANNLPITYGYKLVAKPQLRPRESNSKNF